VVGLVEGDSVRSFACDHTNVPSYWQPVDIAQSSARSLFLHIYPPTAAQSFLAWLYLIFPLHKPSLHLFFSKPKNGKPSNVDGLKQEVANGQLSECCCVDGESM